MYIESVNLGIDHIGTELLQHLGIKYSKDGESYEVDQLVCQYNMFMDDMNFTYAGGIEPHFSVDNLVPSQASYLYKSEDGFGRMFAISTDNYRAISSSVIFGAIKNEDSLTTRPYFMSEMINFLLGITTITSLNQFDHQESFSVINYPNPFTQVTNFEFSLQESVNVRLEIYNQLGSKISTLADEKMDAGKHLKTWNVSSLRESSCKSGIYFYKLTYGVNVKTGKLFLTD